MDVGTEILFKAYRRADRSYTSNLRFLKKLFVFADSGILHVRSYDNNIVQTYFSNVTCYCVVGQHESQVFAFILTDDGSLLEVCIDVLSNYYETTMIGIPPHCVEFLSQYASSGDPTMAFDVTTNIVTIQSRDKGPGLLAAQIVSSEKGLQFQPVVEPSQQIVAGAALWRFESSTDTDYAVMVTFGNDSHLTVWSTVRENDQDAQNSQLWCAAAGPKKVETRHKGWVTALSVTTARSNELAVSGDCLGTLCFWKCTGQSGPQSDAMPLRLIMADRFLCEGHSVSLIQIDSGLLWVGDRSGSITCAHVSLESKTTECLTRINPFPVCSGAATVLQWVPLETVPFESADRASGLLRCYADQSGVAVEVRMPHLATHMFRAWPEIARSTEHKSLVQVCAVLPQLNCVATAGHAQYVYLWDLDSGQLLHTIRAADPFIHSLAVHDAINSIKSAQPTLLVSGHSNGRVCLYELSQTVLPQTDLALSEESLHSSVSSNKPRRITTMTKNTTGSAQQSRGHSQQQQLPHPLDQPSLVSAAGTMSLLSRSLHETNNDNDDAAEANRVSLFDIIEQGTEVIISATEKLLSSSASSSAAAEARQAVGKTRDTVDLDSSVGEQFTNDCHYQGGKRRCSLSHKLVRSHTFSPLPVSEVFFSSHGLHLAVCFVRKFIIVYNTSTEKVTRNIKFDETFASVSAISAIDDRAEAANVLSMADSLVLALQSVNRVKLLDAVQGVVLTVFDLHTDRLPVVCCGLWDQPLLSSRTGDRSIMGLCVTRDWKVFLFGDSIGFVQYPSETALPEQGYPSVLDGEHNCYHPKHSDPVVLDNVVQGVRVFSAGDSPVAAVWSLRRLVLLRIALENNKPAVMRAVEFVVRDDKTRVVFASALPASPTVRVHKAMMVLSDGTVYIVNV